MNEETFMTESSDDNVFIKKRDFQTAFVKYFGNDHEYNTNDVIMDKNSLINVDKTTDSNLILHEISDKDKHIISTPPVEQASVVSNNITPKIIENNKMPIIIISVFVWGEISYGTLKTWSNIISKVFPKISIKKDFSSDTTHIILDKKCDKDKLLHWSKLTFIPDSDSIHLLIPEWVITSLKLKQLQPISDSITHPIQKSLISQQYLILENSPIKTTSPIKSSNNSITKTLITSIANKLPTTTNNNVGHKYMCQSSSSTPAAANMNKHLTDPLEKLLSHYELQRDDFRAKAYKRAIAKLKTFTFTVRDVIEIKKKEGLGESILKKIDEILTTGSLEKLECIEANPIFSLRTEFCKIWGVGPEKADKLIRSGYKSISDIRERGMGDLTRQQIIGLKYFDDLQIRIPRDEVTAIDTFIKKSVKELAMELYSQLDESINNSFINQKKLLINHETNVNQTSMHDDIECITCGSYRRGNATCGDIDILIKSFYGLTPLHILNNLLIKLRNQLFIIDDLSLPSSTIEHEQALMNSRNDSESNEDLQSIHAHHASYMGICRLAGEDNRARHIDIKVYVEQEFPYALLYFTGSDYFNRSMRLYAKKQLGLSLSDTGMWKSTTDKVTKKTIKGERVGLTCRTEKDIFNILGLEYKTPQERAAAEADKIKVVDDNEVLSNAVDSS